MQPKYVAIALSSFMKEFAKVDSAAAHITTIKMLHLIALGFTKIANATNLPDPSGLLQRVKWQVDGESAPRAW